jgi:putative flippase GtrA
VLSKLKCLYTKYKELLLYIIFGVLTTAVNYISYFIFTRSFHVNYLISNVIAWILAVIFAYITNKFFVFESKDKNIKKYINEFILFVGARVVSGFLDTALMFIFVDLFKFNDAFVKIMDGVLVVIINYFFSKLFIFKKEEVK